MSLYAYVAMYVLMLQSKLILSDIRVMILWFVPINITMTVGALL